MRIPSIHSRKSSLDIQTAMTPLIDVVFQLLIFFICASTGHLRELLLPTDLSGRNTTGSEQTEEVEKPLGEVKIRLTRTSERTQFALQEREFDVFREFGASLRQLADVTREIPVYLNIAPNVPLEDFVAVYDACRVAGFYSINFEIHAPPSSDSTR